MIDVKLSDFNITTKTVRGYSNPSFIKEQTKKHI